LGQVRFKAVQGLFEQLLLATLKQDTCVCELTSRQPKGLQISNANSFMLASQTVLVAGDCPVHAQNQNQARWQGALIVQLKFCCKFALEFVLQKNILPR